MFPHSIKLPEYVPNGDISRKVETRVKCVWMEYDPKWGDNLNGVPYFTVQGD